MTNKKRELIEILLDNVKPEDWPESLPYAAQDMCASAVYVYSGIPDITSICNGFWHPGSLDCEFIKTVDVICELWNKTIVHRDEFMKRWNERNQVIDSEGWIQWNGGEMPVDKGTLIDVKYRDGSMTGEVFYTCDNEFRYSRNWCRLYSETDIIAYRLHVPQEQKTPQQLAIEKFGTDWHDNDGEQPFSDTQIKIDLEFKNGAIRENVDVYSSSFIIPFDTPEFTVTKWRIHSDQAALLREPMPPCSQEIPCRFVDEKSPLSTQIGGDHYTKLAIQPMQYSMENGLDALQHTVIKYVTRFRDKNGIEDLEKAKHCIDMLIEFEKESK